MKIRLPDEINSQRVEALKNTFFRSRRINLHGEWRLHSKQYPDAIPAMIPGDTHSALLTAGKIHDPYWGFNEL
jgi:hypothetical protein